MAPGNMAGAEDSREAGFTRRSFAVGAALAAASVGAYLAQPRRAEHRLAKQKLGDLIPAKVGDWQYASNDGIVVAREDGPVDGYDQVVSRRYRGDGLPDVMLLLAYGSTQGGSLQLHRPETCYPAQGFQLSDFSDLDLHPAPLVEISGRSFTAIRDERTERLLYWTRIADAFPRNTAQEYRAILASLFRGTVPDGILVRASSIGPNIRASDDALRLFVAALIKSATGARPILIGPMAAAAGRMDAARNK